MYAQTKGPFILLPTGRRDGNRSVAADVALNSPPPGANITYITALFAKKFNLTAMDVVVLSGIILYYYYIRSPLPLAQTQIFVF